MWWKGRKNAPIVEKSSYLNCETEPGIEWSDEGYPHTAHPVECTEWSGEGDPHTAQSVECTEWIGEGDPHTAHPVECTEWSGEGGPTHSSSGRVHRVGW